MSKIILTSSGTVESYSTDAAVSSVSYSTQHLSSLFASFLTGEYGNTMRLQKYFELYEGTPQELKEDYKDGNLELNPVISRFPVRISSTAVDDAGNYYATFIATVHGNDYALTDFSDNPNCTLTLGLLAGDYLLALTPFDKDVYQKLCAKDRVEIKWKLQLQDSQE